MEQFDSTLSSVIDSTLGLRCRSFGYRYSEIIRSLMSIYFCGGSCIEDVTTHLMNHLSLHPTLRTCSSDTILRAIKELTQENISYTSDTDKNYDFNTADTLNTLLLNFMFASGQLKEGEKYDAKPTYKKFSLYKDIFSLIGWKTKVINGIVFELNSILVEKWKGKAYRLFFIKVTRPGYSCDASPSIHFSGNREIVYQ